MLAHCVLQGACTGAGQAAPERLYCKSKTCKVHACRINSIIEAIMLQVALELGGYIGYSAVRIASQLPPGGKLYSIDPNESHVRIARALIQHAGLSDKVEVIQGILETSIQVHALSP